MPPFRRVLTVLFIVALLPAGADARTNRDRIRPTVGISTPQPAAVLHGRATVSGTASDNVAVASVRVYVDGAHRVTASGTTTWTTTVDTTSYADGQHTIHAQATDKAGNTASTAVTVTVSNASTSAPTLPPNAAAPRQLGVALASSGTWLADLDAYAARVGRMPSVVQTFRDMESTMLDTTEMKAIAARGATPLVTVEPWDGTNDTDPRYTLDNIARGDFDGWFAAGADASRAYGKPYYLRFAPEMNGSWAPWEAGVNGNTPQDFVASWRHVRGIFAAHGATNALWVWAPNALGGVADFLPYYPGSDEVDVLGLDGYNWGSLDVWQSYSQVFGPSYDELCTLDPVKPVMISETAATELGGDKAAWITSAYTQEIPTRTPRVKTVVWFDLNKETDWRVESSSTSLNAFRAVATSSAWG